jgi:hypothetical protein
MSPGPATSSVPSSIRMPSCPLTWYWKWGASQLSVLARKLAGLVRAAEALVLGLVPVAHALPLLG